MGYYITISSDKCGGEAVQGRGGNLSLRGQLQCEPVLESSGVGEREGVVSLRQSQSSSPSGSWALKKKKKKTLLFWSAPHCTLPYNPYTCPDISHLLPTGSPLCLKQQKQPKIELITSLPLANQNPKGLIKIPPVAKPWVMSDFISEISEQDWRMPKQPTCLNTN